MRARKDTLRPSGSWAWRLHHTEWEWGGGSPVGVSRGISGFVWGQETSKKHVTDLGRLQVRLRNAAKGHSLWGRGNKLPLGSVGCGWGLACRGCLHVHLHFLLVKAGRWAGGCWSVGGCELFLAPVASRAAPPRMKCQVAGGTIWAPRENTAWNSRSPGEDAARGETCRVASGPGPAVRSLPRAAQMLQHVLGGSLWSHLTSGSTGLSPRSTGIGGAGVPCSAGHQGMDAAVRHQARCPSPPLNSRSLDRLRWREPRGGGTEVSPGCGQHGCRLHEPTSPSLSLPSVRRALLTMSLKAPRTAAVTTPRNRPRTFSAAEAQSSR